MGVFTYLKLGLVAVIVLAAGYFYWNYNHMKAKIGVLETQVAEQGKVIQWYERAVKIDEDTQEVHNEIKQAVKDGDTKRIAELYDRLRKHQRIVKDKVAPKTNNGGDDNEGD